ncbi:transmembrane protein 140 [Rhinoderma darwinii]|uniref:transmembrane protein 140 n=1 Tax=Rhinoderma darwinii TaxID=43563 RepID=UPI003F672A4D
MMGQKMGPSLRCRGVTIILVQILVCLLLVYALIIGGGNLLVDGCKKIGFYNYCLHNATTEDCRCITQFEDLYGTTSPHGLTLSLILTYSSLVIVVMGLLALVLAQCHNDDVLWKYNLSLNLSSLVGLFFGITTHLFLTWDQFVLSHVTPYYLALLLAVCGLSLQSYLVSRYIRLNSFTDDLSFLMA